MTREDVIAKIENITAEPTAKATAIRLVGMLSNQQIAGVMNDVRWSASDAHGQVLLICVRNKPGPGGWTARLRFRTSDYADGGFDVTVDNPPFTTAADSSVTWQHDGDGDPVYDRLSFDRDGVQATIDSLFAVYFTD